MGTSSSICLGQYCQEFEGILRLFRLKSLFNLTYFRLLRKVVLCYSSRLLELVNFAKLGCCFNMSKLTLFLVATCVPFRRSYCFLRVRGLYGV